MFLRRFDFNDSLGVYLYIKLNSDSEAYRVGRLPARIKKALEVPGTLNDTWSIDFMSQPGSHPIPIPLFQFIGVELACVALAFLRK